MSNDERSLPIWFNLITFIFIGLPIYFIILLPLSLLLSPLVVGYYFFIQWLRM